MLLISILSLAVFSTTEACQFLIVFVLAKLVVVSELLPVHDVFLSKNQDMVLAIDNWGLRIAICLARVVEISGLPSKESGINDMLIVYLEEIAITNAFFLVPFLPLVCNLMPDNFSNILD